jgi:hypothetical protein
MAAWLMAALKALIKKIVPSSFVGAARTGARYVGICLSRPPQDAQIFSDPAGQIFFGYYDVSPQKSDNSILLAMRAPAENTSPHEAHPELEVGYFDLKQGKQGLRSFGKTTTWNWQQGCRLQWFDEEAETVIYNTAQGAVVQNIHSGKIIRTYERQIYALDHQRRFALSLDFARLHQFRRGYGYSNISANGVGITRIDLHDGELKEIFTLDQISNFDPLPEMTGASHYINHLSFNPSGTRLMLFHIWTDGAARSLRLLTAAPDGSALHSPCPDIKPSHYSWMDDEQLLITGTKEGKVAYATVHDKRGTHEVIESPHLNQDGHPSLLKDGTILSDTYPDIFGRQKVFLYHPESGKSETLASFYSPHNFNGEMRCDLHPRLSPAQDKICVDIVHNGRRAMCLIPLRRS